MKHLLGLLTIVCCMAACATSKSTEQREAERQKVADMVSDSIRNRTLTIELDYVTPRRFAPRFLSTEYTVRIAGDSLTSFLPYFGQSYRADMTGENRSPLDYESTITHYETKQTKKDRFGIWLKTRNRTELLTYRIEIYTNGKATLDVVSSDRDPISFSGTMVLNE